MKYIEENFLAAISKFSLNPAFGMVGMMMDRYKQTLRTELSRAGNKEIHIIGMRHVIDPNVKDVEPEKIEDVIESQSKAVDLLTSINPDIVGMEGFCGDKFTPRAFVLEYGKVWNTRLSPSNIVDKIIEIETNPQTNQIINFQKENPHITFCGVEQIDLERMQMVTMDLHFKESKRRKVLENEPLTILRDGAARLRGIMMIAKLSRSMKNLSKNRAALPVGYFHLNELTELKDHLKANWQLYNTAE